MSAIVRPERRARSLTRSVTTVAAAVGVIYGYDAGSISGALLFLEDQYRLTTTEQSVITSVVVLGSIIGAIIGPRMANELGRRTTMIVLSAGFAVFAALSAVPLGVAWLTGVRLLLGITIGLSTVVVPVFISEFAAPHNRGKLGTAYQFFTSAGVVLSLVVSYLLAPSKPWELMLGLSAIPAAILCVALFRYPDSPRWYAMKGRDEEARHTVHRIDQDADATTELAAIHADLGHGEQGRYRDVFTKRYARATFFVIAFGFFVQITGTNTVLSYSPTIFRAAGIADASQSILVSAAVQAVSVVGVVLSILTVDRWERRRPLIVGGVAMVVGHTMLATAFAIGARSASVLAIAGMSIFYLGFYFWIGSLIWMYTGEAFPARLRSVGAAVLLLSDFGANLIATFLFPDVLAHLGGSVGFGAFAVLSVLAVVFMWFRAPETKDRSLEEIRGYWDNGGRWADRAGR